MRFEVKYVVNDLVRFKCLFAFLVMFSLYVHYVIVNQQNECIRENNARFRVPEGHEERELLSGMHEIELINWHNQRGRVCDTYIFQKVYQKNRKNTEKLAII